MKNIDLIGKVFGDLKVVKKDKNKSILDGRRVWICKCKCGWEGSIRERNLNTGKASACYGRKSCKGIQPNTRIGQLTVIEEIGTDRSKVNFVPAFIRGDSRLYKVICDCGESFGTILSDLKRRQNIPFSSCHKCKTCSLGEEDAVINAIISSYKCNAKLKNRSFEFSKEEVKSLITQDCFYCGQVPNQKTWTNRIKKHSMLTNGIDRIDSTQGYTQKNCVTCCMKCNRMKSNYNVNEFYEHIIKICKNQSFMRANPVFTQWISQ
jgi:hypothetical protein